MKTLFPASAANLRNSHRVYVNPTSMDLRWVRSKTKQSRFFTKTLLVAAIIGFISHEQALSAQTESLPPATGVPCPLFVPTSVAATTHTVLPITPDNPGEQLLDNQSVSEPVDSSLLAVTELAPTLYLINHEENIVVFVDGNDVLFIGSAAADQREKLRACITRITELPVKYIINTHQHDSQPKTINTLPDPDAVTIAHEHTRTQMLADGRQNSTELLFTDSTTLFLNHSRVELQHFANSHTNSDIVVLFANERVLHAGDLFTDGYPIIDYASGGSSRGWIAALNRILALDFERIIPDRGPVMTRADVQLFRDWFVTVRTRVRQLIERNIPRRRVARELIMEDLTRPLQDDSLFLRRTLPNLYDELVEERQALSSVSQPTGLGPEDATPAATDPFR